MSSNASKNEPYVPCLRGKHALGELVLVQKRPCVEPKEETHSVAVTPKVHQSFSGTPKTISKTPTSLSSTLGLSPAYRKKRKRINRHWGNSRGREWKAATASPTVIHSPSLTVAMQPELDDVEGLLFVSFTSKVKCYKLLQRKSNVQYLHVFKGLSFIWCDVPSPPVICVISNKCVELHKVLKRCLDLSYSVVQAITFDVLLCDRKLLRFTSGTCQPVTQHQHLPFP